MSLTNEKFQALGLSLREEHFQSFQAQEHQYKSFEIIFENYLFTEGERRDLIQELARNHFVHLHGVTTNIGSLDPLNIQQLRKLLQFSNEVKSQLISDHLCFTRMNGRSSFELLPVPRTWKMLEHLSERLNCIRDHLGQDFLLENISSYFEYDINEMSEAEFMLALHEKSGAKFLFDVNNFFVNSRNFRFSPEEEIAKMHSEMIGAYHLGGHEDLGHFLFDTHGTGVSESVWSLYQKALQLFGPRPTFLERDENIPADFAILENELHRAQALQEALR